MRRLSAERRGIKKCIRNVKFYAEQSRWMAFILVSVLLLCVLYTTTRSVSSPDVKYKGEPANTPGATPTSHFMYSICREYAKFKGDVADKDAKKVLKQQFGRFKGIPDPREGDVQPHVVDARFLIPLDSVENKYVLPYFLSSQIAGLPIEFIGVGDSRISKRLLDKWTYIEKIVESSQMKDSDVVIMTDVDVLFNGADLLPRVKEFLATTPRSRMEIDVRKVRNHQMRSPILISSQENCYAANILTEDECNSEFWGLEALREQWWQRHNQTVVEDQPWYYERNAEEGSRNTRIFPNTGTVVARVWALREYMAVMGSLGTGSTNLAGTVWHCDQSATAGLFLEMVENESRNRLTEEDLSNSRLKGLTASQLTPGLLDMDYVQLFTLNLKKMTRIAINKSMFNFTTLREATSNAFNDFLTNYTHQGYDEILGAHRSVVESQLEMSPTNVPLAPLFLMGDVRSNGASYYQNRSLDGLQGAINISIPYADAVPVAYHFNGAAKKSFDVIARVSPWAAPYEAEGASASSQKWLNPKLQPQLYSILKVLVNAPPLKSWNAAKSDGDALQHVFRLESTPSELTIDEICQSHKGG